MDAAMERARATDATTLVNVGRDYEKLSLYRQDKGNFEIAFGCSAAPSAIRNVIEVVRPLGTIVQVGIAGDVVVPLNALVAKELNWVGSQRFDCEFTRAAHLIANRAIDVRPIISHTFNIDEAVMAF